MISMDRSVVYTLLRLYKGNNSVYTLPRLYMGNNSNLALRSEHDYFIIMLVYFFLIILL